MIHLTLTQEEAEILARLFNAVTGVENVKALLPIHDKLIMAARDAGVPQPPSPEVIDAKKTNGKRKGAQ